MATTEYTFKGKCNWAKVFEDNRDMMEWDDTTSSFSAPSSCGGMYSLELEMDPDDYKVLKKSGSLAAKFSKYDDEGNDLVRFKRKHEAMGKAGLMDWASGPPKIMKEDGSKWDMETDGEIGNGSEVKIKVVVYTTSYSPGTRLESIKVLKHVPVGSRSDLEEALDW